MNILITGANSQLAQCLKDITNTTPSINNYIYATHQELDITDETSIKSFISNYPYPIDIIINCAAYTNVNKAEEEKELAYKINAEGPKLLSKIAKQNNIKLIHISTDYVFDGNDAPIPYHPLNVWNLKPLNTYGKTKLEGESNIINSDCDYLIFRTSWLYSQYNSNFVKSITRKILNDAKIQVVSDQIDSPTSAYDLAFFLFSIIKNESANLYSQKIYHFSNKGIASWYDFSIFIQQQLPSSDSIISPCKSSDFPSPTKRPNWSVLDCSQTEKDFDTIIPHWMSSLKRNIGNIQKNI